MSVSLSSKRTSLRQAIGSFKTCQKPQVTRIVCCKNNVTLSTATDNHKLACNILETAKV